jgi:L-ornithine N5-oxygenase
MEASIYPEYVKEHYDRTWEQRHRFNEDLKYQNYSSADFDVLQDLNTRSYVHQLNTGKGLYNTFNNSEIQDVSYSEETQKTTIQSCQIYTSEVTSKDFDLVILATGFRDMGFAPHQDKIPSLLADLSDYYTFDKHGVVEVSIDYELQCSARETPPVYLNGLCEGTHGVSDAGSFSLLALRTEKIVDGLEQKLTSSLRVKTG